MPAIVVQAPSAGIVRPFGLCASIGDAWPITTGGRKPWGRIPLRSLFNAGRIPSKQGCETTGESIGVPARANAAKNTIRKGGSSMLSDDQLYDEYGIEV